TVRSSGWRPRSTPPKRPTKPCGLRRGHAMNSFAVFFLAAIAVGGVVWVFLYPILSGDRQAEKRMETFARPEPVSRATRAGQPRSRREVVESTLKELEERNKKSKSRPLSVRIEQAGLTWTK